MSGHDRAAASNPASRERGHVDARPRDSAGVSRRETIRALAGMLVAAAGFAGPAAAAAREVTGELETWLAERLGRLDWSALAPALGAFRGEASPEILAAAVLSGRRGNEPLDGFIERTVRDDFAEARVVDLAGWRVARTEARLLAMLPGR